MNEYHRVKERMAALLSLRSDMNSQDDAQVKYLFIFFFLIFLIFHFNFHMKILFI